MPIHLFIEKEHLHLVFFIIFVLTLEETVVIIAFLVNASLLCLHDFSHLSKLVSSLLLIGLDCDVLVDNEVVFLVMLEHFKLI